MKRGLVVLSSIGAGWIFGIVLSMIMMPYVGNVFEMTFGEAMENTLIFGFPGLVLLMIAIVLSQMDDSVDAYNGDF